MGKKTATSFLGWAVILACFTGCGKSDVGGIKALLPVPLTPSAEIIEIFKRSEQILDSNDDPGHGVSRKHCREILAQVKARYGDTKNNAELFKKQFKELGAAKLKPDEKENAFGTILLRMSQAGLAPDAARKAEAASSPTIRAIAPFILGQLQFGAERYADARKSFLRTLTLLKTAPESRLKDNLIFGIVTLAEMNDSMLDVVVTAEGCVSKNWQQQIPGVAFSQAWCKIHKDDLIAGRFELILKRAEAAENDQAKAEYVRAVIKEQMKRGEFAGIQTTIDRIFPSGTPKKEVPADQAAIFGRFDGRDLCLETWAIGCTQHGKLADAMTIADSIEELKRRNATVNKMIGVLIGEDVKTTVLYGLLSDTFLGGDTPNADIPTPKYSDEELLKFCRWYAVTGEQWPPSLQKIQRTASAAGLMSRLGFKTEADELFDKAFADMLALERKNERIFAVEPIVKHRINAGDFDAVFDMIKKLSENEINVSASQKIEWFCAMDRFGDAIALASEENLNENLSNYLWIQIGRDLAAADQKDEAKKIFEKVIALESAFPDRAFVMDLLQVGMIDEAFRYVERLPNAESRSQALRGIAGRQWADGNTSDAEKTLLEAIKQVEKMDAQYDGNRHVELQSILSMLTVDRKLIQLLEKRD